VGYSTGMKHNITFRKGDRVDQTSMHKQGLGTVDGTQQDGRFVMVNFDTKTASGWGWALVRCDTLEMAR